MRRLADVRKCGVSYGNVRELRAYIYKYRAYPTRRQDVVATCNISRSTKYMKALFEIEK